MAKYWEIGSKSFPGVLLFFMVYKFLFTIRKIILCICVPAQNIKMIKIQPKPFPLYQYYNSWNKKGNQKF